jgi:toxin FitB
VKWLFDTDIVSESVKPRPNRNVLRWVALQPPKDVTLSIVTIAELRLGAALTRDEMHQRELSRWIDDDIVLMFGDRVLPITMPILIDWLDLMRQFAAKRRGGAPADLLLSATARAHGLIVVTRNIRDFAGTGTTVYNPWTEATHNMETP